MPKRVCALLVLQADAQIGGGFRRNRRAVASVIKQFATASSGKGQEGAADGEEPEGAADGGGESPTEDQAEKVQRFVTKNEDLKRCAHAVRPSSRDVC